MKRENIVKSKSLEFSILIVQTVRDIQRLKSEFVLSDQLLKSGTSIGANIYEAEHAESKKDFIHKMSIALKEANESKYWIVLLTKSNLLTKDNYKQLESELNPIIKILISLIKTAKRNLTSP